MKDQSGVLYLDRGIPVAHDGKQKVGSHLKRADLSSGLRAGGTSAKCLYKMCVNRSRSGH